MKIENIDSTLEEIQEVGEQMRVINTSPADHCMLLLLLFPSSAGDED
jgi:hypothetical protein